MRVRSIVPWLLLAAFVVMLLTQNWLVGVILCLAAVIAWAAGW